MDILIAGNLAGLAGTLAQAFTNERMRVVLAGPQAPAFKPRPPGLTTYPLEPTDRRFREVMASFGLDAAIYLGTREEHLLAGSPVSAGRVLDGLVGTLEFCKAEGVRKVFFISSTEIYGGQPDTSEAAVPQPASANGFALLSAEQICRHYAETSDLEITVVRVPLLYAPGSQVGLLSQALQGCRGSAGAVLPAAAETEVSLLPEAEVADFLLRALDLSRPGLEVVNLSSARPITLARLGELLQDAFPGAQVSFDATRPLYTRAALVANARRIYDWIGVDAPGHDMPALAAATVMPRRARFDALERLKERFPRYPGYLKWVEVVLGALVMMWLTELTGSFVEFRYVDFRLIYVILIASTYGTQLGLVASLLACISVVLGANRLGLEWTELFYNVANWLPFAVYIAAGAITGYMYDKRENETAFHAEQNRLINEKYELLYGVHQDIVEIKDQYHQQLLGSRDSFGRIFNVTRELDTLHEEEVLFKALTVLEDVMESSSIAIYSLGSSPDFARLEAHSSALGDGLARSLDLAHLPNLQASIRTGEIYQNRRLAPGYPAYFAPLLSDGKPVAAIAIWEAKLEQGTLYYYNLFKVMSGLIQSSIHRAIVFLNANADLLYLPGTRILRPEPFKRTLRIKNRMRMLKSGTCLLARVLFTGSPGGQPAWPAAEASLARVIRTVDDVGTLEDGSLYILFSQADESHALGLTNRLAALGLCLEPVNDMLESLSRGTGPLLLDDPQGVRGAHD